MGTKERLFLFKKKERPFGTSLLFPETIKIFWSHVAKHKKAR